MRKHLGFTGLVGIGLLLTGSSLIKDRHSI